MQPIGKSSQCDVPPKFISRAAPIYPISRLRRGESGYADIVFTVDKTGHTRDFNVWKTTYLYFANHAILAVQNWRFQPSFKMDILYPAVASPVHVPIRLLSTFTKSDRDAINVALIKPDRIVRRRTRRHYCGLASRIAPEPRGRVK
jgi:TonB family protein